MSSTYTKTTNRSRRLAAAAATERLMAASTDDPRAPGYVSKKPRNALRDANRTKGLPYANCAVVRFVPGNLDRGVLGAVLVQQKARGGRVHVLDAVKGQRFIPAAFRAMMGLMPVVADTVEEGVVA